MKYSVVLSTLLAVLTSQASAIQPWATWGIQLADTSVHFRYSEGGEPPLLLVHGSPQHSPTWATIGPILAEQYTVIAPDNRGQGESALSISDNYTAPAAASDLKAILNFLAVNGTLVLAHDKGVGLAAALALENPGLVEKMILAEYVLQGFGYATTVNSPQAYQDWQLRAGHCNLLRHGEGARDAELVLLSWLLQWQRCHIERCVGHIHPRVGEAWFP